MMLATLAAGCAGTIDGSHGDADGGRDVPPGVNPNGVDPFHPVDAGLIVVDGAADTGVWQLPDAAVFDQRYGYLYVGSYFNNGAEGAYASAEFRLFPRPDDPRCSYVSAGNWDVVSCDDDGDMPPDTHPRPFPQAGVITIRGGSQDVSLDPDRNGQYMYFYEQNPVYHGPLQVNLRAAGSASVPAFTLTAAIPSSLELTAPAITPGGTLSIPLDQDLTVSWRTNEARSIYVSVSASGTLAGHRHSIRVIGEFPAGAGMGVLPRRALRSLAQLAPVDSANFSASPQNLSTQRIGTWPVQLTTAGPGVSVTATLR